MEPGSLAAIFIAVIGALASWASHRASTRATNKNTEVSARVEMEKEAYERARKLDIETIARQDAELQEMLDKYTVLMDKHNALIEINQGHVQEIRELKDRVERLEEHVTKIEGSDYEH